MNRFVLGFWLLYGIVAAAFAAEPVFDVAPVFEAGTLGYAHFRIPTLVVTNRGTLLAFCEARKSAASDWTAIDILMRRSTDGGTHWEEPVNLTKDAPRVPKNAVALKQNLAGADEQTYNNPAVVVDRISGEIHFLFCAEYARCFYAKSGDDGLTFTQPEDITPAFESFRSEYDWRVIATGPGHGIQLTNGRLLIPVWLSTGTGGHAHRPSCVSVIFSDDHGRTWQRGEIAAHDSPDLKNPSESVALELSGGRVLLNIRSESAPHRRAISISPDGAAQWSKPEFHESLFEPVCMASLVRLDGRRVLFVNPDNRNEGRDDARLGARENLTAKVSEDEGRTWRVEKVIDAGAAGYSDLAVDDAGRIHCLYERGSTGESHTSPASLSLATFNWEWVREERQR